MLPLVGVLLAVILVLTGVLATVVPRPAEPQPAAGPALENDEVVLATLDPSGLPIDATLVSTLTARGGERRVVSDPASTVNVGYLSRRGSPPTGSGVVLLEVGGPGVTSVVTEATFDKPLPVALHAEYRLDGDVVAPEDLVGAQGDVWVRYTVTNTTAESTTVRVESEDAGTRTRDVPVFVPFAGSLDVIVPPSTDVVDAGGGVRATDEQGRAVLRFPVLLAPPLGDYQPDFVIGLRTWDGTTPEVILDVAAERSDAAPAAGFSASSLADAAQGNRELADGLGELGAQAALLGDGAVELAEGADDLSSGTSVLADQVGGALLDGSIALDRGAAALAAGTADLATGLDAAVPGASELALGVGELAAGLDELSAGLDRLAGPEGLPQAVASAGLLTDAAEQIAVAVGSPDDPRWPDPAVVPTLPLEDLAELTAAELVDAVHQQLPSLSPAELAAIERAPPTLVQSVRLLEQASELLTRVAVLLVQTGAEQKEVVAAATIAAASAATDAAALAAQVCGPAPVLTAGQCAQLDDVVQQAEAAKAATAAAAANEARQQVLAAGLAAGLAGMEAALGFVEQSVVELAVALSSGQLDEPGLVEGLELLATGVDEATAAAQLAQQGAGAAAEGSQALVDGADDLAQGLGAAAAGASAASEGADDLAAGTAAQRDGVRALSDGARQLAEGADQAAAGSQQVAAGVRALADDGIDPVTQAVRAAADEPALAAAWLAATDARAAESLPYGAPVGAVGHAAYRLSMPATVGAQTPAWQWWLLGLAAAGGAAVVAQRRLRT
jgi:putative membrane protein